MKHVLLGLLAVILVHVGEQKVLVKSEWNKPGAHIHYAGKPGPWTFSIVEFWGNRGFNLYYPTDVESIKVGEHQFKVLEVTNEYIKLED